MIYLKYWTLNLRPLMVYPKALYLRTLVLGQKLPDNLAMLTHDLSNRAPPS